MEVPVKPPTSTEKGFHNMNFFVFLFFHFSVKPKDFGPATLIK